MIWLPLAAQRPWARDPSVKILAVGREGVPSVFPTALPLLAKSLTAGRLGVMGRITPDDIFRLLVEPMVDPSTGEPARDEQGRIPAAMQLFVAVDPREKCMLGAIVTEILEYPQKRVCVIALVGGVELERWLDGIRDIELWAKDHGCQQVEVPGRRGWERVLSHLGYQPVTYTCAKEIA